jgi:hypothetical protein
MDIQGFMVALDAAELDWLRSAGAEPPPDAWFDGTSDATCELEDAFIAVHFLLVGTPEGGAHPLAFLNDTTLGEPVLRDLGGLSPGRIFTPAMVHELARHIETLPARAILERLSDPQLGTIHPFTTVPSDDHKEWLLAVLQTMMVFIRRTANSGRHLLVIAR